MRVLADAFADVCSGQQRSLLIGAEGGVGKTRLIREASDRFRGDALVLVGWCVEQSEPGLPFAPFVAVVRQLVRERGVASVAALIGRDGARELARLLPEFGPAPSEGDPGMARSRLFESFRSLLQALCAQTPVVLVIEDLHWADRATRDLLAYLARNLTGMRLLLIVSYRTEALAGTHPLRSGLAELARVDGVTALALPRLGRSDVALQLAAMLGREPAPDVVAAVYARSGGVPLFTEAMLAPDGTVRTQLPASIRDLLLGLVNELSSRARDVLRAMAVGGFRVGHRLLVAVAGADGIDAALREAVACHALTAPDDAGYAFRHALIQEAIRDDLLPGERSRLHRGYAEAFEADPSLGEGAWVAASLAVHWRAAGDAPRALMAAWQAAGEATGRLAYADQLVMLEQVLELWEQVDPTLRPEGADRARVQELAANAACWAVEPEHGMRHVEEALANLDPLTDAPRVAALLLERAMLRQQALHPGELDDLRMALRLATAATPLRAEALGQACRALYLQGHVEEMQNLAGELSELADQLDEPEWQVESLLCTALIHCQSDAANALALLDRALGLAQQCASGRVEMIARVARVGVLDAWGEHTAAVETARLAWRRARELGQARYMGASIANLLARSLAAAGQWDEAVEVIGEALDLDPSPLGRMQLAQVDGLIAVARGNLATARRCIETLSTVGPVSQDALRRAAALAQLTIDMALVQGDHAAALQACAQIESLRGSLFPRLLWPVLAAGWRAWVEGGGPVALGQMLSESSEHLAQPGPTERAFALTCLAERNRREGRPDAKAWSAAVAAWDALGRTHAVAYALTRQAAAALAAGDRAAGTAALRRAARLARQLGAQPLVERIATVAGRGRVELWPEEGGGPSAAPFGLTARELEVLKLLGEGRSNREIAAELFITVKTASVHVSNILAKLDVPSRGAAAAAANRLGFFSVA